MKRWVRTVMLSIALVMACGCWDRREVNDIGLVMGTGLDLTEDGKIMMTLQVAVPSPSSQSAGGTSKETDNFFLISESGKSVLDIDQKIQQKMSRKLVFSHRSVILVGESLARRGMNDFLDIFSRNPRNRLRTYLFVVKGKTAGEMLQVRYPYEMVPAEALKEMELLPGAGMKSTLRDFLIASAGEGENPAVGVLEGTEMFRSSLKGKDKQFRLTGTAVFKRTALVGFLNNRETQQYLWFKNNKNSDNIVADLPGGMGNVGLIFRSGNVKIDVVPLRDDFRFHVHVTGKGDLMENNSRLDVTQLHNETMVKKALEDQVKEEMEAFLRKLQHELKTDILGFGGLVASQYPKKWRAVGKDWDRYFENAEISVSVKLSIKNTGALGPSLQWKEKEIVK
ncbi:Ger(x)C family spore germination protein [Cohnella sp. CFH 77786]|uniref:Ger(x)C family spore germination protein n=1 Tax=Cohnella sp. CFH 77786 TaxID=2662265 RepID=UPI001C6086C1|nr:Ger(x)C family spore germination protein [Cohnella sp. CFH 77786]